MLKLPQEQLQELLLTGHFGLEKESLRVTEDGRMSHTPDPFLDHPNITKDFCENQTEINTPVADSAEEARNMLWDLHTEIERTLAAMEPREYLWPFSNPPYIADEEDIPIAQFPGEDFHKTAYWIAHQSEHGGDGVRSSIKTLVGAAFCQRDRCSCGHSGS